MLKFHFCEKKYCNNNRSVLTLIIDGLGSNWWYYGVELAVTIREKCLKTQPHNIQINVTISMSEAS